MEKDYLKRMMAEAGREDLQGGASPEAWRLLDLLDSLPTRREKALALDHQFNALVAAVVHKVTGRKPNPE